MKLGIAVVFVPVALYLGFCALLYTRQRALLYYPTPGSPGARAESMLLESGGETLVLRRANPDRPRAILYFGGNGEDVARNLPSFRRAFPHHAIYLVHYRGYGGSSGSPSEQGLFADALNVYDHVRQGHREISAIGRSLGSGVAIHLAAHRELERLVMVTPFDSVEALVRKILPIFPTSLLLTDKYRSIDLAPGIRTPTLVAIAERDEVIPRESTDRLVAAFDPAWVSTHVLDGATHNTIGQDPAYLERLQAFLDPRGGPTPQEP